MGLALVWGCRSPRERDPRDQSTAVGNPGDMTVRLGPAPVALERALLPVARLTLTDCAGVAHAVAAPEAGLSLLEGPGLALPALDGGLCGLALEPDGPLVLGGVLDDGRTFSATIDLGPLALALAVDGDAGAEGDAALALVLGDHGWLDAAWLPAEAPVVVAPGGALHDVVAAHLEGGLTLRDAATGAVLAQARERPPRDQPGALVAVGASGLLRLSFDGGASWAVSLDAPGEDPEQTLAAVVAVPDHPEGPRAVAVGGGEAFVGVQLTEGPEAAAAEPLDRGGALAVAWTGRQLVAVGPMGLVSRSDAGRLWDEDPSLDACYLTTVAAAGTAVVALGEAGCSFVSEDGGLAWTAAAALDQKVQQVVRVGGRWVARLDDGGVVDGGPALEAWTAVDLGGDSARELVVDGSGVLRILGHATTHATADLAAVVSAPDDGLDLRRWVAADTELVAMDADGRLHAAPLPAGTAAPDWSPRGTAPTAPDGSLPRAFAVWPR